MKKQVVVSVSGGETSALLAKLIKDKENLKPVYVFGNKGKPIYTKYENDTHIYIFAFANTSREDKRTLIFVDNLKRYFGINCIWVEADVHDGRIGTTHKIVDINSAKQDGSVFESVINKYGIPNREYIHCTRELKSQPIKSLAKSIGFDDYETMIGYRFDEPKRVNFITAAKLKQVYPLFEWKITKQDVKAFWSRQQFKLGLQEWEGNCKLCYKKSKRKLLTQIVSDPESVNWIKKMEHKYRYFQKTGRNSEKFPEYGILFFRENESIYDLLDQSKEPFIRWEQAINIQSGLFDFELDQQESCSESCEPF